MSMEIIPLCELLPTVYSIILYPHAQFERALCVHSQLFPLVRPHQCASTLVVLDTHQFFELSVVELQSSQCGVEMKDQWPVL